MSNFENRFIDIIGEDYDFDHDIITDKTKIAGILALMQEIPTYKAISNDGVETHSAWSEDDETFLEVKSQVSVSKTPTVVLNK